MGSRRETGRVKRKRKENLNNHFALIGVTLVVLSLALTVGVRGRGLRRTDLNYEIREEALMKEVEREEERSAELAEYRVYVQTKQYIERIAKEKLGLVNPDEVLLKPSGQ